MKKNIKKLSVITITAALLIPSIVFSQNENDDELKNKEEQQIIITTRGDQKEKIVVEINDEDIRIKTKPFTGYAEKKDKIDVRVNKLGNLKTFTISSGPRIDFNNFEKRAMLGVTTEKAVEGVRILQIVKGSAAEKAGLKEDDIITHINETKVTNPEELTAIIKKHKPGDKVSITYLRNKKEQKVNAELTKWKKDLFLSLSDLDSLIVKTDTLQIPVFNFPGIRFWGNPVNNPRLGISVQDTDDGKGVKVIDVVEESNAAKAGIKEEDIITHVDDKAVNNVDEISKLIKEKMGKLTVKFNLIRNGKPKVIEIKMPRKLKTAEL